MYPLFGFSIPDPDKKDSYLFYHFVVLPFGAIRASQVTILMFSPVLNHIVYDCGQPMVQYIDDGSMVYSKDLEEAKVQHEKVKAIIKKFGFVLNDEKEGPPNTTQKILGFNIDTKKMTISCDFKKLPRIHENLYYMQGRKVPVKNLASAIGKIISLTPSLHFPPQVFLYKSIRFMASVVKESTKEDWETQITVPIPVLQELTFCLNSLPLWTGRSIEFLSKVKSFDKDDIDHPSIKDIEVYAGDAGMEFKIRFGNWFY